VRQPEVMEPTHPTLPTGLRSGAGAHPSPPIPQAPTDHVGWQATLEAHRLLMVDPAWTTWHGDGFTWWAHRLAQRFRFEGPVDVDGTPIWWLGFETDYLRGVDGDETAALTWLFGHNRLTNFGAWVLEGDRLRIRARVAVKPDEVEERARTLVERAMVVNALAHRHEAVVDGLATTLTSPGLAFDVSGHPERGVRPEPDELLGVLEFYREAAEAGEIDPGRLPNLNGAVQFGLIHGGWVTGGQKEGWARCRFAWGAIGLRSTPIGGVVFREFADDPPVVDLRVDAAQLHPVLGPGTLVRVIVPVPAGWSFAEGVRWANALNLAELAAPRPASD
jgi:hypothetical protein